MRNLMKLVESLEETGASEEEVRLKVAEELLNKIKEVDVDTFAQYIMTVSTTGPDSTTLYEIILEI